MDIKKSDRTALKSYFVKNAVPTAGNFADLIDPRTKKTRIRTVDIDSDDYHMARRYMIRLEKEDLAGEELAKLAKLTNLSPEDFKSRFSVAVD